MNRPRITKETLKELRGKLLTEQNERDQKIKPESEIESLEKPDISINNSFDKENEQEIDM